MQTKSLAELNADFSEEAQREILWRFSSWLTSVTVSMKDGQIVVQHSGSTMSTEVMSLNSNAAVLVIEACNAVAIAAAGVVRENIEGGSK